MKTVEVTYLDGIVERHVVPPTTLIALQPDTLEVGDMVIERRHVRRWRIYDTTEDR